MCPSDRMFDELSHHENPPTLEPGRGRSASIAMASAVPQVIAITSGKGGVGKTSIAVNLATAMAIAGRKTMLLDGDLSLANVDVMLGLTPAHNLSHVLEGKCRLEDTLLTTNSGLMVVPAPSGKKKMADLSRFENAAIVRMFSDLKVPVETLIVDTAAGIPDSVLTLAAASQEVLVVVTNDPASITDAYALIKVLSREHGVNRVQILANQVANLEEARQLYDGLERVTERFLEVTLGFAGAIPYDNWLKAAVRKQRPVVELYPSSPSALAFTEIAARAVQWQSTGTRGNLEFFVERQFHCRGLAA